MGIFSFFSKEKKETLDKGLEKTKESFFGKLTRAVAVSLKWTMMYWIVWRRSW